jgi:hypothetical protein
MSDSRIDRKHLEITGAHKGLPGDANIRAEGAQDNADEVTIVITQAYGPGGHQLIGISDYAFDGYPALTLLVRADGREGLVHLSPLHGDDRKLGFTDIPVGTRCELLCPTCEVPLDVIGDIEDGSKVAGQYCAIYLTPALSEGSLVMVSNIWGHYHSRIVHDSELISFWASQHAELDEA